MTLSSLLSKERGGGVLSWFDDQSVYLSANARAAIRKVCDVIDLGHEDEVLAPAYNCGSEIDALLKCGVTVSLYRVMRSTSIDLADIERRITPKTKAIYVTHYFGFPQPEIASLKSLCERRRLYLIEDCAVALFSELDGRKLGSFGDVAVFCFYKYFPTIGGGALLINNPALAGDHRLEKSAPFKFVWKAVARATLQAVLGKRVTKGLIQAVKRMLGRGRQAAGATSNVCAGRPTDELPDMPDHYYFDPAFNNAGMSRLTRRALRSFSIADTVNVRRANYLAYLELLDGQMGVECLFPHLPDMVNPLNFPVIVHDRDTICDQLNQLNIAITPWWKGYNKNLTGGGFPETLDLKKNVLTLPLHQYLDRRHVEYICRHLLQLVAQPAGSPNDLPYAD